MDTDARQHRGRDRSLAIAAASRLDAGADSSRLAGLRQAARSMADDLAPDDRRAQPHRDISPMLWHIGHVFFVEHYWLAEHVFGDTCMTDRWRSVYFPETCPKPERCRHLPDLDTLKHWVDDIAARNDHYWARAESLSHPLLDDGYLHAFVRQHYAQHLETMRLGRAQLDRHTPHMRADTMTPQPPPTAGIGRPAASATIGCESIEAYDNEQSRHARDIASFSIARQPVTNAQYWQFICDGGYNEPAFWSDAGWAWRCRSGARQPQHWSSNAAGQTTIPATHGTPVSNAPVHGINAFEADAFACYANARLPHETEWEAACLAGLVEHRGQVWEWCANALYPYPGFQAFPYAGYSQTWFDGAHRVVRGGSCLSEPDLRRPSFRNFYPQSHRHVFAGLRLAW